METHHHTLNTIEGAERVTLNSQRNEMGKCTFPTQHVTSTLITRRSFLFHALNLILHARRSFHLPCLTPQTSHHTLSLPRLLRFVYIGLHDGARVGHTHGSGNQLSKNQLKKRCKFVLACIKGEPVAEPTLAQTGAAKRASDADTAAATGPGKAPPNKRTSNLKTKKSSKSAHEKQHHTATVTSSSAPAASLPAPSMPDGVTAEWIANLVARVQEDTNARFFINYPNNYQTPRDASTPTGGFNPMPSGFGSDSFTSPNMHNAPHAFNGPSPHTPHNLHNPHSQPKSTYGYGLTMPLGSGQGSFTSRDFLPMPSAFSGPPPSMQYGHDQTKPSGLHTGSFTSRDFLQLPSVNRYGYDQSKPSGLHTDSPTSPDFLQTPSLNQRGLPRTRHPTTKILEDQTIFLKTCTNLSSSTLSINRVYITGVPQGREPGLLCRKGRLGVVYKVDLNKLRLDLKCVDKWFFEKAALLSFFPQRTATSQIFLFSTTTKHHQLLPLPCVSNTSVSNTHAVALNKRKRCTMEHSSASPSRAVSPSGSSNSNPRREKRKLESFVTESGDTWEFPSRRPVKKSRSSGPVGSNTSSTTAQVSPTYTQRPSFSATSPPRAKRSREPSDDADAQSPSKRQMTSVTELDDQAAVLRRASWLRFPRSRRQEAAASRSRSPSQSGLRGKFDAASAFNQSAGSVEVEELPDYESDEEEVTTIGQHANSNLEEVASLQESAMNPSPADHFQEGQELTETAMASIETDHGIEHQVGSSHHSAPETVKSGGEYTVVAGNGVYEAASTTRPAVWSSLDSRLASTVSLSPVARYKLARADSSGSESDVESPQPLRSRFSGFIAQAPATIQHRSEAQQQSAREPGYTSTSASGLGPVTAMDTAPTVAATTKGFDPTLSPIKEASIESVEGTKVQRAMPSAPELHSTTSTVKQRSPAKRSLPAKKSPTKRAPSRRSPTKRSPSKKFSGISKSVSMNAPSQPGIMDAPSQQLLFELEKYASDRRNWFAKQVHNEVNGEEVKSKVVQTVRRKVDRASSRPHKPDASIPSAPITSTSAHIEEETQQIMAVDPVKGPDEDDIDFLRICMGDLDHMDVDSEDDLPAQNYSRDRIRKLRDEDIRRAKLINESRRKIQNTRMLYDEAPDVDSVADDESDQDNDEILYTDHLIISFDDGFHAEKLRLQAALEHWESSWPKPSSLPSEHWTQEALTFATNQANATNSAEKHYWACRSIQAESYAEGKIKSGRGSNIHIAISLIDWKKSIAASEEEATSFADQVNQISLTEEVEEDQEAPLRAKLALFLSDLPPELDQKVTEVLNVTNPGRAIVKSPEGNDLTRKDFATLLHSANYHTGEPEGWLNDEIINGFFTALCNGMNDKAGHTKGKVPPYASYITGWYSSVTKNGIKAIERWSRRKGIKGDKLLQCKRIFFPVNPGNHWSLLVVRPDTHTIEYLDSLDVGYSDTNRKSARYIKLARQWLEMELGKDYVADQWKEVDRRSAIQNNGSDCGVFTCLNGFASALELSNPTNEFGPEQIPYARRAMVSLFNLGGFNKHFEL
ncbi:cysteine proteinase, partial [Aureobasidium sp. EXF-3399]